MDIHEFLTARLDENERQIRTGPFRTEHYDTPETLHGNGHNPECQSIACTDTSCMCGAWPCNCGANERFLAEIAADRRMLARHRPTTDDDLGWWPGACHGCGQRGEFSDPRTRDINKCPELRDFAAVYTAHPDYNPDWSL